MPTISFHVSLLGIPFPVPKSDIRDWYWKKIYIWKWYDKSQVIPEYPTPKLNLRYMVSICLVIKVQKKNCQKHHCFCFFMTFTSDYTSRFLITLNNFSRKMIKQQTLFPKFSPAAQSVCSTLHANAAIRCQLFRRHT